METNIPKTAAVLATLLRADLKTQWRNRRSVVLTLLIPVIILLSWKGIIEQVGGAFALASCITIGHSHWFNGLFQFSGAGQG